MSPADASSIAFWMLWPGPREITEAWAVVASTNAQKQQKNKQIGGNFFVIASCISYVTIVHALDYGGDTARGPFWMRLRSAFRSSDIFAPSILAPESE